MPACRPPDSCSDAAKAPVSQHAETIDRGRSAAYSLAGSKLDGAENRALRLASIYPRIPVGYAAVTLRTRFTGFADRATRSRPLVNTRPSASPFAGHALATNAPASAQYA